MSKSRKEKFQNAIRLSLKKLLESGSDITKQIVICNAHFEDGSFVGATTLYSRHKVTKEFVHKELLYEIDGVIEKQRKRITGKTNKETKTSLNKQIKDLKKDYEILVTQVVEQESRMKLAEESMASDRNIGKSQEVEIYVLAKTANELAHGAIWDFKTLVSRFEEKHRGSEILALAQKEISSYLNEVVQSKLVSLDSVKKFKTVINEINLK